MNKALIALIFSLAIFDSCQKHEEDPEQNPEYILFGHFYGFCVGEQCVEIFKLTEDGLFEDDTDQYPNRDKIYEGNYKKLGDDKYQLVKSLFEQIPSQLLNEKDTVIGAPDASDGGGIYFAIKDGNGTRFWLIDQFEHNIPEYLKPFKQQVNNSISLINE